MWMQGIGPKLATELHGPRKRIERRSALGIALRHIECPTPPRIGHLDLYSGQPDCEGWLA